MTPILHQAELDPATLAQLFRDLAEHAEVLGISAKGSPTAYTGGETLDLVRANAALVAGAVRGIQIRYRYAGEEWWDTLLRLPHGVRLVRTRPDFRDGAA